MKFDHFKHRLSNYMYNLLMWCKIDKQYQLTKKKIKWSLIVYNSYVLVCVVCLGLIHI